MVLSTEKAARRQQIEMHIDMHRDSAAGSLLEVGRWLNTAKDEGIVPYGEWTAWVAQHAAMSERVAQKWMQAARELPPGSPLERLGIAKIQSLMMIESGEREEFAARIGADKLTSREVEQQVKAARAERDEALRVVGEQKKRILNAQQEKQKAVVDAIARTRADVSKEKDDEIERVRAMGRAANRELLQAEKQRDEARSEVESLRTALEVERRSARIPDPKQERKIRELQEALDRKEQEIDRLSDELDAAQTAAMRGGMTGGRDKLSPSTTILSAIGALMAQAGRAPGELARLQGLDAQMRDILCGQARLVGQWAMQILAACGEGDAHV